MSATVIPCDTLLPPSQKKKNTGKVIAAAIAVFCDLLSDHQNKNKTKQQKQNDHCVADRKLSNDLQNNTKNKKIKDHHANNTFCNQTFKFSHSSVAHRKMLQWSTD